MSSKVISTPFCLFMHGALLLLHAFILYLWQRPSSACSDVFRGDVHLANCLLTETSVGSSTSLLRYTTVQRLSSSGMCKGLVFRRPRRSSGCGAEVSLLRSVSWSQRAESLMGALEGICWLQFANACEQSQWISPRGSCMSTISRIS